MPRPYVLGEPLVAAGLPPWDGTGVPLPVNDDGWPVIPDENRVLRITSPVDGAHVDPLVDIIGRGAPAGATVDLYVDSSPGAPVASVTAAADGTFTFTGTTPLDVAEETLTVGVGAERSAAVTVHVNLPPVTPVLTLSVDPATAQAPADVVFTLTSDIKLTGLEPVGLSNGDGTFAQFPFTWTDDTTATASLRTGPTPDVDSGDYHASYVGGSGQNPADSNTVTVTVTAALAAADAGYEPADHTVAEVQAYLAENPDQSGYVLDRERAGKARTTLIGD